MLFENLDDDERIVAQVEHPKINEHIYIKRPLFTGKLDDKKGS